MPRSFLHGAYEEESECRIRTDGCFCGGVLMSLLFCCGLTLSASYGSPVAADEAVWIGPQYNDDLERVSDDWFSRVEPPPDPDGIIRYKYINWDSHVLPSKNTESTRIENGESAVISGDGPYAEGAQGGNKLLIAGGSKVILRAGTLVADIESIGDASAGFFVQENGEHTVNQMLTIGVHGNYTLKDGTLAIERGSGEIQNDGVFEYRGGYSPAPSSTMVEPSSI